MQCFLWIHFVAICGKLIKLKKIIYIIKYRIEYYFWLYGHELTSLVSVVQVQCICIYIFFFHCTFILNVLFYIIYRILSWNSIGTTWLSTVQNGTVQFSTVCVSTSSVQNYSRVVKIAPPLLPWLLKNFFIPPCSDIDWRFLWANQWSVEFTRHVLVTVRFAWNQVPGTVPSGITPQEWAVLNRTVP